MATSTQWRLNITANVGGASYTARVYELILRTAASGAQAAVGGTASASSASLPASNAFDGSATSAWSAGATPTVAAPQWLQYTFASSVAIVEYAILENTSNSTTAAIKDFQLQYFDGSSWVTIDTRTGITGWADNTYKTFSVANTSTVTSAVRPQVFVCT